MIEVNRTVTGSEGITLTEAKAFLRVDFTEDDDLITDLIGQSRDLIEQYTNRSLIDSTIKVTASKRKDIVLPFGLVSIVNTVTDVETSESLGFKWDGLVLSYDSPNTTLIEYETVEDNTEGLILGWHEIIAYLYENRGDSSSIALILYNNQNLMVFRRSVWI